MTGAAGDGGGLHVRVAVSDDTPICRRLRACGLHGGYGLVALEPVAMGAPVVEYVGEILSREQVALGIGLGPGIGIGLGTGLGTGLGIGLGLWAWGLSFESWAWAWACGVRGWQ